MNENTLKVLLVDDEESLREPLATTLRSYYDVDTAANGKEALAILEEVQGNYQVALIDQILDDDMGGIELLKHIKLSYPKVQTIIFTGWGMEEAGLEALRQGAYRYIAKPFNLEELVTTIRFAAEEKVMDQPHIAIEIPLPYLVYFDEFIKRIQETIESIDFLYAFFSLLESALVTDKLEGFLVEELLLFLNKNSDTAFSKKHIEKYLSVANIEPLRIASLHYGSPAIADLLGIGQGLETVRDIVKDLAWRGKYERQLAELDIKNKQAEVRKSKLEIQQAEIDVESKRLELEKISMDVINKKLEVVEKVSKLRISKETKKAIISKALIIAENQVVLLPMTGKKTRKKN